MASVEARMLSLVGPQAYPTLGPMAAQHLATGGKRLRARLALEAAQALGGRDEAAMVQWAAACELMHNATLVHDDLQDGDTKRRGAPTVWVAHGAAQAINVGDLMLMAPYRALLATALPPERLVLLVEALSAALLRVIEGQGAECAMTERGLGDLPAYRAMIAAKTSALFALPVTGAAILAGRDAAAARALGQNFMALGELFQLQDDVLDLFGDKGRGQLGSDIYEGKVSALVAYHVHLHPEAATAMQTLLRQGRDVTTPEQVLAVRDTFEQGGALAAVLDAMDDAEARTRAAADVSLCPLLEGLIAQVRAPIAHVRRPGGAS